MTRRVLVQQGPETFDLVEVLSPSEHHLQEIMKAHPQLIPADDLGIDGDLLIVGRETSLASGYIDLLCLSQSGEVVLIEFKTGPQNPDFRHALAQLIDYGSDLWRLSVDDFDRGVVQRYLAGSLVDARFRGAADLDGAIARAEWNLTGYELESLRTRLAEVLATGAFHYVVAAQRFTTAMQTSLDYLNATMSHGQFFLVEIIRLEGGGLVGHAAQVVASPPKRPAGTHRTSAGSTNEAAFLDAIDDGDYRDALHDLLAGCTPLGLVVEWGSRGASIRLRTPDRQEPLSVGWLLPEGSHWAGVRHSSFGVDPASLALTPTVMEAAQRYVAGLREISGAVPTTAKGVDAFTFTAATLPRAHHQILEALAQLVKEANGSIG